jgi:hypothetical protein
MLKLLAPALVMFPLLNGITAEAATVAMEERLVILESHPSIEKVEEACGNGYFRDGNGNCLPWYGDVRPGRPHEQCPPDRHFVHWANHQGGFCKLDY